MWRINKITTEDNDSTKNIEGEFGLFYDKEELKTYSDIKNKFKDFKIDEEYVNELKEEECQSISYFRFFLTNGKEEDIYLFLIKLEVCSLTELTYEYIYSFTVENDLEDIQDFSGNYFIKIKYETNFFKFLGLENEYEDDEDENEEIPAIIENSFASDNCLICLKTKPNILNFPCLHLSQCEECENIGRFINCSICRLKIERKVKI